MSRAGLDKDPRAVASMFDGVARRYDLVNTVLSAGMDRWWREVTHRALNPRPGERVLDLAAGSGISTARFARSGAWCLAADFSMGMLSVGRDRAVPMVAADALRLPFADGSFDAVTILFGLRNLVDTEAGLREMSRVLRPGGRLVVCEFSTPTWEPFRTVYMNYVMRALPPIARLVSSNPAAYIYLAESIRAWPDQETLANTITAAGFRKVAWRNLTSGAVTIHRGFAPE